VPQRRGVARHFLTRGRRQPGVVPGQRRKPNHHRAIDTRGRRGVHAGMSTRLSISTPVVTMFPQTSADWEKRASIEELTQIAEAQARLGHPPLTCSEHIALPASEQDRRGARYWDPLATLGYVAARTQRIRLATHVLVLGYHHPLEIAKRYGTLDKVSNGRLI